MDCRQKPRHYSRRKSLIEVRQNGSSMVMESGCSHYGFIRMNSIEMVQENIRIASESRVGELKEEDFRFYEQVKKAIQEKIKVPCTGCGYCTPCPKGGYTWNFQVLQCQLYGYTLKGLKSMLCVQHFRLKRAMYLCVWNAENVKNIVRREFPFARN